MEIKFGPATQTVFGKEPDNSTNEISQREGEITILVSLLEQAVNVFRTMEELVVINKAIKKLDMVTDCIEFTNEEIDKIRKTYTALKERPVKWVYYGDLFEQLINTN